MAADNRDSAVRDGQKRMAEAMDEVDEALQRYIHAKRYGGVEQAREQLHGAVMTLYSRMEPHLQEHGEAWEDVGDCDAVDGSALYNGVHPRTGEQATIKGFRELPAWRNRVQTITESSSGSLSRGGSTSTQMVVRPPGEALITIAQVLRHYYVEFGLGLDISTEQQTHIDDALLEEVKEWRQQNI